MKNSYGETKFKVIVQIAITPVSSLKIEPSITSYEQDIIVPMGRSEDCPSVSCDVKIARDGTSNSNSNADVRDDMDECRVSKASLEEEDEDACSALVVRSELVPQRPSKSRAPGRGLRRCSPLIPSLNPAVVDGPSESEDESESDLESESDDDDLSSITSSSESDEEDSTLSSPALSPINPSASQLSTYVNPTSSRVPIDFSSSDFPSFVVEAMSNPKPMKPGPRGDLRCYACNSLAKRDIIRCDYDENYGRLYRCCDNHSYRLFLAYDDVVGNLPDNPLCRCGESMKLQVSRMRVRSDKEEKRAMYFRCRRGTCTLKKDVLDEDGRCFAVEMKYLPMLRHFGIC